MKADWDNYELILFNLIQNAVKYNNTQGDIFIIVSCKKKKPVCDQGENIN